MALSTKSFKAAPAADRASLLAEREKIDVQLAETDESDRIRRRREAIARIDAIQWPSEAELKRTRCEVTAAKENLEAKLKANRVAEVRYGDLVRAGHAIRTQELVFLEKTKSAQIQQAVDEIERKILRARSLRQSVGRSHNFAAVEAFEVAGRRLQNAIRELVYSPLDEAELAKEITKMFRSLPKEKFTLVEAVSA
jgi:hypothetical protein